MTSRIFTHAMHAFERGAFPRTRKWAWRRVYNVMSLIWGDDDWRFMNYGYVPPGEPFPLAAEDEPDRPFIGLYHQAMDGLPVAGAQVLEVGSGRGGGSSWIARTRAPAAMMGLDYSPDTVRRARRLHAPTPGLTFETGDAERLPVPDASVDIVVNIESSHCYADVPAFAREVARVLKPGGWFTFADMRPRSMLADLDRDLGAPGLDCVARRDLTRGVVAALDMADAWKRQRLGRVRLVRRFATEFAGAKGSLLYKGLAGGYVAYVARRYRKVA